MKQIYWETFVDKVYCIHHLPQERKLGRLYDELRRVDLMGHNVLQMRFTTPTRYDGELFRYGLAGGRAVNAGCVNLGLEVIRILDEALANGYRRIMVLENDVAFLRSKDLIRGLLDGMPAAADLVQFDKFIVPNGTDEYARLLKDNAVGCGFFRPDGATFYSGACFVLSRRGMEAMRQVLEGDLQPPDSTFVDLERMGVTRVVSGLNMAIQLVYAGSISADLWGIRSHHDGYMRGGVEYDRYNLPEGYGYGSAL